MKRARTLDELWLKLHSMSPAGDPDECWLWQRCKTKIGYGTVWYAGAGKMLYVHRVSLERKLGREIEPGKQTLHSCHNRACWNPAHLREGTAAENAQDRDEARNMQTC